MARPQFYRFFLGDYLRDAAHLSLLEHGVYRRLIDLYMTAGEPLPFDVQRLFRVLHATSKEEQQAVQQVIEEFFRMDGPVLRNHRCDLEIRWQDDIAAKAAGSANARWKSTLEQSIEKQADACARNADAMLGDAKAMLSRSRSISKEKIKTRSSASRLPVSAPSGFDVFWSAYPKKRAKQDAIKAFMELAPDDALQATFLTAIAMACKSFDWTKDGGRFIPYAAGWLRGKRWEDELSQNEFDYRAQFKNAI